MKKFTQGYTITIVAVIMLLLSWGQALADDPQMISVAQPRANDVVSSLTIVAGSVDFPNFERYEIFLQGGDNMIWAASGYTPVVNGNLARLDPRVFSDGTYQLIIRQVRIDSNYSDYTGPVFVIDNPLDAPLAYYPEIEPTILHARSDKAILRVKNCSGQDLNFDYNGPSHFVAADASRIKARREGAICTFYDAALTPGEYRGTVGIDSGKANTYELVAKAGKIYQIIYNGPESGKYELIVEEVQAADSQSSNMASNPPANLSKPSSSSLNETTDAPAVIDANNAPVSSNSEVLPTSGQAMTAPQTTIFFIASISFILFIVLGGVLTFQRGRRLIS
jgi:hypothetical protein